MLEGPKDCLNLHETFLVIFFELSERELTQKTQFSSIENLDTFCSHIDTWWQLVSLSKSEYLTPPIQMELSKNQKAFAQISCALPESA